VCVFVCAMATTNAEVVQQLVQATTEKTSYTDSNRAVLARTFDLNTGIPINPPPRAASAANQVILDKYVALCARAAALAAALSTQTVPGPPANAATAEAVAVAVAASTKAAADSAAAAKNMEEIKQLLARSNNTKSRELPGESTPTLLPSGKVDTGLLAQRSRLVVNNNHTCDAADHLGDVSDTFLAMLHNSASAEANGVAKSLESAKESLEKGKSIHRTDARLFRDAGLYGWAAANDANLPVDSGADPEYDKRLVAAVAANKKATDEKQAAEDRKKREERDKAERSLRDRYDKPDRRDRDIGNGSGGYGSNWPKYGRGKRY
jgi:hypothetical protein